MANIEKRDGKYRVQIRKKGFPHITKTFNSREEATIFAKTAEEELEKSKILGETPKLPLKIWLDRFEKEHMEGRSEKKRDLVKINFWKETLGDNIATEISPEYIQLTANSLERKKTRIGAPIAPETIRKYIVMLSCVYKTAIQEWKWAFYNPCSFCQKEKKATSRKKPDDHWESHPFRRQMTKIMLKKKEEMDIRKCDVKKIFGISPSTLNDCISREGNPNIKNLLNILNRLGLTLEIKEAAHS